MSSFLWPLSKLRKRYHAIPLVRDFLTTRPTVCLHLSIGRGEKVRILVVTAKLKAKTAVARVQAL